MWEAYAEFDFTGIGMQTRLKELVLLQQKQPPTAMDSISYGSTGPDEASGREPSSSSRSLTAIASSNKGFQLLKKHGWKEGTGLGISEQGMLEPLEAQMKQNKRGLGADRVKKKISETCDAGGSSGNDGNKKLEQKKSKALSKKARKMQDMEKRMQDKEFERAFFREFWPENV